MNRVRVLTEGGTRITLLGHYRAIIRSEEVHFVYLIEVGLTAGVPFRIEYPLEKSQSCRRLLGLVNALTSFLRHRPFISSECHCPINGNAFLYSDMGFVRFQGSLFFWFSPSFQQAEGEGVPIKWHRDASADSVDNIPAIDVGSSLSSNRLSHQKDFI